LALKYEPRIKKSNFKQISFSDTAAVQTAIHGCLYSRHWHVIVVSIITNNGF